MLKKNLPSPQVPKFCDHGECLNVLQFRLLVKHYSPIFLQQFVPLHTAYQGKAKLMSADTNVDAIHLQPS